MPVFRDYTELEATSVICRLEEPLMVTHDETLSRRSFAKVSLATSLALTSGGTLLERVLAQGATPMPGEGSPAAPGLPPLPEGATLYAEGLLNPRALEFGDDGTLYITENGIGGDEVVQLMEPDAAESEATPGATPIGTPPQAEEEEPPVTRGYTGRLSKVATDGTLSVIVDGLASYTAGAGPNGIALGKGVAYVAIGGIAIGAGIDPLPEENTVNRVDVQTGELTQIAYLGQYEVDNNPDGTDVNPNLYMMVRNTDGMLLVCDAGGNTVYSVDPDTGDFTLVGVVPDLMELAGITATPEMGSGQPVPTAVAVAADGTIYVSLLNESWPAEAPSLLTMSADGTFTPVTTSEPLHFIVSLVAGPDGNLYASQLFGEMSAQGPGPGRVLQVTPDGTVTPVVEGVMMPQGVAFDADGNLYVAINSLMSGPGMAAGQVIRVEGIATGA